MIQRSKDYHNEVTISSLQGLIKRPLKDNEEAMKNGYCNEYWYMEFGDVR